MSSYKNKHIHDDENDDDDDDDDGVGVNGDDDDDDGSRTKLPEFPTDDHYFKRAIKLTRNSYFHLKVCIIKLLVFRWVPHGPFSLYRYALRDVSKTELLDHIKHPTHITSPETRPFASKFINAKNQESIKIRFIVPL